MNRKNKYLPCGYLYQFSILPASWGKDDWYFGDNLPTITQC